MVDERPLALGGALEGLAARRPDLSVDVHWFDVVASTMELVARSADAGSPAGYVVLAGQQTAGRGRRGHTWSSPSGAGLYFSYLARPARHLGLLTLAVGVGVQAGISHATGLSAQLKWPNDLLFGTRKVAGVLAEGARVGSEHPAITIGVGVNLQPGSHAPDVAARATSLEAELGRPVDRVAVFITILEHVADALAVLDADRPGDTLRAWRAASPSAVGTQVSWTEGGVGKRGVTGGIDDAGCLLVRTSDGVERIVSGDVQWHFPDP